MGIIRDVHVWSVTKPYTGGDIYYYYYYYYYYYSFKFCKLLRVT
jgi:hypothetical protein